MNHIKYCLNELAGFNDLKSIADALEEFGAKYSKDRVTFPDSDEETYNEIKELFQHLKTSKPELKHFHLSSKEKAAGKAFRYYIFADYDDKKMRVKLSTNK